MARKYYRRRRFYRRKGLWSSNIQALQSTKVVSSNNAFGDYLVLAYNESQNPNSVSQKFTIKNIEVSGQVESNPSPNVEDLVYYIVYVPEGFVISDSLPIEHPEWIMAYKYIGQSFTTSGTNSIQPPKIVSRLARKLSSGDRIVFMYTGANNGAEASTVSFRGLVRWWSKSN